VKSKTFCRKKNLEPRRFFPAKKRSRFEKFQKVTFPNGTADAGQPVRPYSTAAEFELPSLWIRTPVVNKLNKDHCRGEEKTAFGRFLLEELNPSRLFDHYQMSFSPIKDCFGSK
jgi:hypothetical protein